MNIITGDILQVVRGGIICHQVNCRKVAGRGLAKQIRDQISGWYGHFQTINGKLGDVDYFHFGDTVIASLYAQDGYGTTSGRKTDYVALEECLDKVRWYSWNRNQKRVYIPERMGCGIGGGNWDVVREIIVSKIPDATIVKLEGK